jgi:hypothetical protein
VREAILACERVHELEQSIHDDEELKRALFYEWLWAVTSSNQQGEEMFEAALRRHQYA